MSVNMVNDENGPYDWPYGVESNGNGSLDDAVGHGTMVTGLIEMLAPKAEILVIRISDSDGVAEAWSVIKGLSFAASNGAEVANISFGSVQRLDAVRKTMDYLAYTQMHIVAPAGNLNTSHAMFPAMESRVICVTGLDESSIKAEFSNYDTTADVSAPATGIMSAWWDGSVGVWSGTSFAAPLITGSLATALSRRGPLSDVSTRNSVRFSGDSVDSLNPVFAGKLGRRINFERLLSDILYR
jgi:subtilisin family serine protease